MIYAPGRFLFIHIPRTAGNSITSVLASKCAGRGIDVLISTTHIGGRDENFPGAPFLKRHARAVFCKKRFHDFDSIYKFAVVRPVEEIVESQIRLAISDINAGRLDDPTCPAGWKKALSAPDLREHFMQEWDDHGDPVDWYCRGEDGEGLGFDLIPFKDLRQRWKGVSQKCGVPYRKLPHLNKR